MELWVRSQDREKMLSNPILMVDDNKILTPKNDYRDTHLLLGHYKSKERALEVLDEIQNILLPKYLIRVDKNTQEIANFLNVDWAYISIKNNGDVRNINNVFIYEMPEE